MASTRISDIRGPQGLPSTVPGPQGAPGVNAIPADNYIADRIATPGTATEGALAAKIAALAVSAVDESGAPIPDAEARIVFNSDGFPVNIELTEV